jgi:GAF domain-containing protein
LHLSPADPLQEQLQALQLKVRAVVPQVQRLTPIYDSRPLPPEASGRGGSSVVLPVSQDGRLDFVVGFHAPEAAAFSEAEQATLEALAELIGLTVRNHFNALRWPTISLPCEILKPAITSTGCPTIRA